MVFEFLYLKGVIHTSNPRPAQLPHPFLPRQPQASVLLGFPLLFLDPGAPPGTLLLGTVSKNLPLGTVAS